MNRKLLGALVIGGLVCVGLAVTVAVVGSRLDDVRLERDDLQAEVEDLRDEVTNLTRERDAIKTEHVTVKSQADEQMKTIEQLKAELERARTQAHPETPANP